MNVKKIVCIIAIVAVILSVSWYIYDSNCTHAIYRINIDDECVFNDHVGNDWIKNYTLEGKPISNGDKLEIPLGRTEVHTFKAIITEDDKLPDTASEHFEIAIKDKSSKEMKLVVREYNGRYAGGIAEWYIKVNIKFLRKVIRK